MKNEDPIKKVVVIGGTGLIGSRLVTKLGERGHIAIPASPNLGVNTVTGEGLAEVLEGASAVVDVSNSPSFETDAVMEFFTTSTRNLLEHETAAGVKHHVALSIIGIDEVPESGYYRAKVEQERLIKRSSVPYTIVRSAQFFEFIKGIADASTSGSTVRLAPALIQPIAADDVASVLCEMASGEPVNGTVEIAGPEVFRMDGLAEEYLRLTGDPRIVVSDPEARYFGGLLSRTTLIPGDGARLSTLRFHDWFANSGAPAPPRSRKASI